MGGNHSPRHSSDNLQPRRATPPPVSSPWNQVVRGESETVPAAPSSSAESAVAAEPLIPAATAVAPSPEAEDSGSAAESSENGGGNNGGAIKRPAWNKPSSNGGASEVRPVMDAVSWPALSESTRAAMKSDSPSKGLLDGSSSVPQSQVRFLRDFSLFQCSFCVIIIPRAGNLCSLVELIFSCVLYGFLIHISVEQFRKCEFC